MARTGPALGSEKLCERLSLCLRPADQAQVYQACTKTDTTEEVILNKWLGTWTTSLMGSDSQRLKFLAADADLAAYVKVIRISDDSELVDPYSSSQLPSEGTAYNIWPRDDAGSIDWRQLDCTTLQNVLLQKLIRPYTILVRDYRIEVANLKFCSEMAIVRDLFKPLGVNLSGRGTALRIARDVVEAGDLAMTSIKWHTPSVPLSESSPLHLPRFAQGDRPVALGSPRVSELRVDLVHDRQGQGTGFSMLQSVDLRLDHESCSYWLDRILHHAGNLEHLSVSFDCPSWNTASCREMVVPKLRRFRLFQAKLPADLLYNFLAASANSLTELELRQVTLSAGSKWSELFSTLATHLSVLESFRLVFLREDSTGRMALDYRELLSEVRLEEQHRAGLEFVVKGPAENRRATRLFYKGPNAAAVLGIVAKHGRPGIVDARVVIT
ncbi:hypothetical protein CERZMDRAFT_118487 [Cercospora zeae-maydis SCOH1-5]|uniref:Uncharacterized protein n=1 Tax=Cercospora zeae-maydis SCOH1-5 TaxID=717836 RepID=A0A6A6F8Q0_9PEZI|nr:hypothetical protein CERZMDRAFT_118487 [Cercospora zeae-maydis SCOH1-5]